MGAPVRFQKAVPRSKENAAVERREARWSALWAGSSLPLEGQVRSQDGPTGAAFRAREFRRSASLFLGLRRVRNRQFGTTARRDAPRGNAPARLNNDGENDDAEIEETITAPRCRADAVGRAGPDGTRDGPRDGPSATPRFGKTNPRASAVEDGVK